MPKSTLPANEVVLVNVFTVVMSTCGLLRKGTLEEYLETMAKIDGLLAGHALRHWATKEAW